MALYRIENNKIIPIDATSFDQQKLRERNDLQRMIKERSDMIAADLLIVAEEFGDWSESRSRIDLLAIDKSANLVVIELKRTEDGGYMELQALRYAAMISTLTFDKLIPIYQEYMDKNNIEGNAENKLLEFLVWDEQDDDKFAQDVKIILVSANFSKELTTSVMWLVNEYELDIRCVRMTPYNKQGEIIIDAQTIIPLPEASGYQIQIREKKQKEREARANSGHRDHGRVNLYYNGNISYQGFKKSDIGLNVLLTLKNHKILDREAFQFLKSDRSCSFELLKTKEEVTETEKKYGKYRVNLPPELQFEEKDYYVARNWGRTGSEKFKEVIEKKFPKIKIEFVD